MEKKLKCSAGKYYYIIGGAVQLGETTEKCIEQEIENSTYRSNRL